MPTWEEFVGVETHNKTKASDMTKKYCSKANPLPISTDTISSSVLRAIIIGALAIGSEKYLRDDMLQRALNTCKRDEYHQFRIDDDQTVLITAAQPNVFFFAKCHLVVLD